MSEAPLIPPTAASLQHALDAALGLPVQIRHRKPNLYAGHFPSEIVTCRLSTGATRRFFCKYGGPYVDEVHATKGGVAYEARVYQTILAPLQIPAPAFVGSTTDPATNHTWLILDYLPAAAQLHPTESTLVLVAQYLADLHRRTAPSIHAWPFLQRLDAADYRAWAERAARYSAPYAADFPWLAPLCRAFATRLAPLLDSPPSLIHGECYRQNTLLLNNRILAVDWESAAIAPGLIDLATLVDCWPDDSIAPCVCAYQSARWPAPASAPPNFSETFDLARLYLHLRWLGDRPDWTTPEHLHERAPFLRTLAHRLAIR